MKKVLAILLIVAVIAVAVWLMFHFGLFGLGKGSSGSTNSGTESSAVSEESAAESAAETSAPPTDESSAESSEAAESAEVPAEVVTEEKTYIDVTVSENSYLYQNVTMELDTLITELEKLSDEVTVRITDEKASLKAYEDLTKALDEKKIPYEDAHEEVPEEAQE